MQTAKQDVQELCSSIYRTTAAWKTFNTTCTSLRRYAGAVMIFTMVGAIYTKKPKNS